jgi:mono/diheme cytochrome c family protein
MAEMRELKMYSIRPWLRLGCLTLALGCGDDSQGVGEVIEEVEGDDAGEQSNGDGDQAGGDGDESGEMPGSMDGPDDNVDAGMMEPGGDGDTANPGPSEAFLRGEAIAVEADCVMCHQENFAGAGYFPNITPHTTTGIGKWTDAQIADAIVDGLGNDGKKLCAGMPKFAFSDAEMADLIVYLRGLAPIKKEIKSVCPGHGK